MKIWIICRGKPLLHPPKRCTAAVFAAACAWEADRSIVKESVRPIPLDGKIVYAAPGQAARQTAELCFGTVATVVEPLLEEPPLKIRWKSEKALPLWFWRLLLWLWRLFGGGKREAAQRCDELIERLEQAGRDCVLICSAPMIRVLLDRFRVRSCCVSRTGVGSVAPLERFLVTPREAHCGGCAHNCLLSNPGCGVGKDKAARKKRQS